MASDFTPVEEGGSTVVVSGYAFGQGPFSAGPFGGGTVTAFHSALTVWTNLETGIITDFTPTGDLGQLILATGSGYGEGGYGEGGYGGQPVTSVINAAATVWVNIDTP